VPGVQRFDRSFELLRLLFVIAFMTRVHALSTVQRQQTRVYLGAASSAQPSPPPTRRWSNRPPHRRPPPHRWPTHQRLCMLSYQSTHETQHGFLPRCARTTAAAAWDADLEHVGVIGVRQQVLLLPAPLGCPAAGGLGPTLAFRPRHVAPSRGQPLLA
jgi:hypothetical protein